MSSLQGERITNVDISEITVWVGSDLCRFESRSAIVINCFAPVRDEPVMEDITVSSIDIMTDYITSVAMYTLLLSPSGEHWY